MLWVCCEMLVVVAAVLLASHRVTCVEIESCVSLPATNATFYRRHTDRTRSGYDEGTPTTETSSEDCGTQCSALPACLAFQFTSSTGDCQLKSSRHSYFLDVTSGTDFWESYTSACHPNPCANLGQCVPGSACSDYTCKCLPNFEGTNCETMAWTHNLVINPTTPTNFNGWNVYANGGNGCVTSSLNYVTGDTEMGAEYITGRMRTSYGWCRREQFVDLLLHFTAAELDAQPAIKVSEWVHHGSNGRHQFRVDLMDASNGILATYDTGEWLPKSVFNGWQKLEHIFPSNSYGTGVRKVRVRDGGRDTLGWAGHYGSQMTAASVFVHI